MWKLHPPLHAQTLSKQRMKLIVNLDDLGSMGIMFPTRVEPAKRIWQLAYAWRWPKRRFRPDAEPIL